MALPRAREAGVPISFFEASAEAIPVESGEIDAFVTTGTLCSIPRVAQALVEIRRVLKPRGRLLFVEHGPASEAGVRRWQNRLTPAWRRISCGCHLNRPIAKRIEHAGFRMERLEMSYMPGLKLMTYMYEGAAVRC